MQKYACIRSDLVAESHDDNVSTQVISSVAFLRRAENILGLF